MMAAVVRNDEQNAIADYGGAGSGDGYRSIADYEAVSIVPVQWPKEGWSLGSGSRSIKYYKNSRARGGLVSRKLGSTPTKIETDLMHKGDSMDGY